MLVDSFLLGTAAGVVLTLAFFALRKAYTRRRLKHMFGSTTPVLKKFSKATQTNPGERSHDTSMRERRREIRKAESEKASLEERETKLGEMLGEMRKLILQLTEIVARTNNASGEASERFEEARSALANLGIDPDINFGQVRFILLSEIDKMVQSNAILKKQLMTAQIDMSSQQDEIDKLKTRAHMDTLTQLLNRAAFDDHLRAAFSRWEQEHEIFSLLMLDVDHFKKINDSYGHLHGDRILKEIADKIKIGTRDNDTAARFGGEEFAVIFRDTPAEEALAIGQRIRETIERFHFQVDNNPVHMTISGGIAQSSAGSTAEEVVDIADKALYQSKERGRNRITLGEDRLKEAWTSGEGR